MAKVNKKIIILLFMYGIYVKGRASLVNYSATGRFSISTCW